MTKSGNSTIIRFTLKNSLSELERLTLELKEAAERWGVPHKTVLQLNLVLDELFTNVVSYGYDNQVEHEIAIILMKKGEKLLVTMIDDGRRFDPTGYEEPKIDIPLAEKEPGGMGILLARRFVDEITYQREDEDGKNIVTVVKSIG